MQITSFSATKLGLSPNATEQAVVPVVVPGHLAFFSEGALTHLPGEAAD